MISGDLNPGDNVFIASFLGIGELLWMFSVLIFFLNFQTRRKPTTLFSPQKKPFPPLFSQREGHSHSQISLGMKHIKNLMASSLAGSSLQGCIKTITSYIISSSQCCFMFLLI